MSSFNKLDICPLYPIISCNVASIALTVRSLFSCKQNLCVVLHTTHTLKLLPFVHGQGRFLFLSSVFYEVAASACKFSISLYIFFLHFLRLMLQMQHVVHLHDWDNRFVLICLVLHELQHILYNPPVSHLSAFSCKLGTD